MIMIYLHFATERADFPWVQQILLNVFQYHRRENICFSFTTAGDVYLNDIPSPGSRLILQPLTNKNSSLLKL